MKRAVSLSVFLLLSFLLLASCAHNPETPVIRAWLDTLGTNEATDVGGNWIGPLHGWGYYGAYPFGTIPLIQQGHRLSGAWADAEIIGTVSGSTVVLVAIQDEEVIYTFHLTLTPTKDALLGKYCEGYYQVPDDGCSAIVLTKQR